MKKKILFSLLLTGLFMICINSQVRASYHASDKTVTSGGNINITITSTKALENFDVECSNTGGLNYKSCSSVSGAAVNSSGKKVSYASIGGKVKNLATYKFTAPKVTEQKQYTVKFIVNDTSVSARITVKPKTETTDNKDDKKEENVTDKKSNNANLSTLGVTPKEYDFTGFSKDKTSYSVTVPNDVDKLNVAYRTADLKAKVKVTGNTNLEVGTNNIKVVVTAEDGKTTKTYTIKVTKLAIEDEKPGNLIDDNDEVDLLLKSLSLDGLELSPKFASDVYSYTANIDMDTNDMSKVRVIAEANNDKATVEITGNTNLVEGENLINVIVKASNSSEQTVYQITVNKVSGKSEVVASKGLLDNIKKEYLIIGGFIFIVVVILAIIIINYIRNKNYYYEDEDETSDELEDNDMDNTQEVPNNVIEELFNKKKNGEALNQTEEETIEDIEKENDRIFNKPKAGVAVEYDVNEEDEKEEQEEIEEDPFIRELKERRKKGKHF